MSSPSEDYHYSVGGAVQFGETTEEAVRIRYLRWPIVIFVFAATELTTLMSHVGAIDVKVVISTMIIPVILAGITFAFVFKPRFKMTWDR